MTERHARAPAADAKADAFKFSDVEARRQKELPNRRKGERTRDSLKLAAIEVLGDIGYHDMRLSDICERADVSPATFYIYFENKTVITVEVLTEFLDALYDMEQLPSTVNTPFGVIRDANRRWLRAARANSGLFRCVYQLGDEIAEFNQLMQRVNYRWYRRVAASVAKRVPGADPGEAVVLLAAYGLGAILDEIARKLVVYPDPHFLAALEDERLTDDDLAEFLSVLWFRAIYGTNPPDELQSGAAQKLKKIVLQPGAKAAK